MAEKWPRFGGPQPSQQLWWAINWVDRLRTSADKRMRSGQRAVVMVRWAAVGCGCSALTRHSSWMGQLSCSLRRVTPLWIAVLVRRRSAELLGVKSGFSRSRCCVVVPSVLACVHMYILYVCVYMCVCVYVCGHVYMYMYACVHVYVYACIYIHVCIYVYAYLCIECRSQYQCFSVWTVSCMRMWIRMHLYVYAYVCKYTCMCIFLHWVLHALWNRCPVHQCTCRFVRSTGVSSTSTNTFSTHSLQGVHICMCINMYICMHVYMDVYVRLWHCLTRWGVAVEIFCLCVGVQIHAIVYVCACMRVYVHVRTYVYVYMCVCVRVCIYLFIHARVGVHMHSCRRIFFICTVQSLYYMRVYHRCFWNTCMRGWGEFGSGGFCSLFMVSACCWRGRLYFGRGRDMGFVLYISLVLRVLGWWVGVFVYAHTHTNYLGTWCEPRCSTDTWRAGRIQID